MFNILWLISHLSPGYYRRLSDLLENPRAFYRAAFSMLFRDRAQPIILLTKSGQKIPIRSFMSLYMFDEVYLRGVYVVPLQGVRTIIDIGANTGLFSLWASQRWPRVQIVAIEPEPHNVAALRQTIAENHLSTVRAVNAAVSTNRDPIPLYLHPKNVGAHSTVRQHSSNIVLAKAITLGDALDLLPGETCDLLKIDCEGAEEQIIRSLTPEMAKRIKAIVYEPEWGLYSVDSLNAWLKTLGYRIERSPDTVFAYR